MKKVDKYIIKAFAGPFVLTFFITLFILLMQFLWKYIDDLVGKGLEWYLIAELLFYASANMVPLAIPLAVLLSSLMTFGNLGERFELAALKASGISMFRFMRSVIIATVFITIGAFLFSNYALPKASLKFWSTLIDITRQKPALNIKPNVFYNDIENYSLLIEEKEQDNINVRGIRIDDMSGKNKFGNLTIAEKGQMFTGGDSSYLILNLENGSRYQHIEPENKNKKDGRGMHMRTYFDSWEKTFDLSGFEMTRTSDEIYKNHYRMLNMNQLTYFVDSMEDNIIKKLENLERTIGSHFVFHRDSNFVVSDSFDQHYIKGRSFLYSIPEENRTAAKSRAQKTSQNILQYINQMIDTVNYNYGRIAKHEVEWHRKLTLPLSCLVFLFVGAPLGAIIRKGGFGLPVVSSVIIFVLFYVLNIMGEKFAEELVFSSFFGMWLAIFIMFPFSMLLTYKAKNDTSFRGVELIRRIKKFIENRKKNQNLS